MFPVFPVRFLVSSQFPANGSMVFPAFPAPAARAMSAISLFLSYTPEHWERWEQNRSGQTSESRTVEQVWNDREQSVE